MRIKDSVALVAGGGSGLGRAAAELLRERGATVVVLDLPAAQSSAPSGRGFHFAAADVRDPEATGVAVEFATQLGELRTCVTCAGVAPVARVLRDGAPHRLEDFQRTIDVNLVGTFNVLRLAAATMARNEPLEDERGVIVNTASIAAFDGQIGQAAYAASKGGVASLTLAVARDLAEHRIRCVTIAPGLFQTPLLEGLPRSAREALAASVPHPSRLGDPAEFAAFVGHVVETPMLNGEVVRLDGALRMAPR